MFADLNGMLELVTNGLMSFIYVPHGLMLIITSLSIFWIGVGYVLLAVSEEDFL
jgi:hypothetical protein